MTGKLTAVGKLTVVGLGPGDPRYMTPEAVLQAWLTRSPDAMRNLLNPMLHEVGVGYCHLSGGTAPNRIEYAWTLVLATQNTTR